MGLVDEVLEFWVRACLSLIMRLKVWQTKIAQLYREFWACYFGRSIKIKIVFG